MRGGKEEAEEGGEEGGRAEKVREGTRFFGRADKLGGWEKKGKG